MATDNSGSGGGDNGGAGEVFVLDRLVLTYDRARDKLEVSGKVNSTHLMLDMLARATRVLEQQLRVEGAMQLQEQLKERQRDQAVADALRRGR